MRYGSKLLGLMVAAGLWLPAMGVAVPDLAIAQDDVDTDAASRLAEAERLVQLGRQHYRDAEYEAAIAVWQQALTLVRTLDQPYQEGNLLYSLGEAYDRLEQYPQALAHYQQALDIARAISFHQGEGMCLEQMGDIYVELGQYLQALQTYRRIFQIEYSLTANHTNRRWHGIEDVFAKIYREIHSNPEVHADAIALFDQMIEELQASQDPVVAGLTWRSIAIDYETQREFDRAIPFYQDAIALFSTLKNWDEAISTLERLGTLYQRQQQPAVAIALYQEALERFEADLTPESETRILEQLANLYRISGDGAREIESYQQILGLIPEEEERWGHLWGTTARYRITMLLNLGQAYGRQERYDLAQSTFDQLLRHARAAGDRNQELDVLRRIGAIQRQNQQDTLALETYQQALAIAQELAPPRSDRPHSIDASIIGSRGWQRGGRPSLDLEIATLLDLSTTYSRLGQETAAGQAYQDALQLSRQLNGLEGEFVTVYHLAQSYDQQLYQGEKAIALYQDALRLARELNDVRAQIYVLIPLGERYSISGPYSEAINAYQTAINLYENHSSEADGLVSGTREQDLLTAIALSYQRLGKYADAIRLYQQALDASDRGNATDEEILLTHYLGTAYRALGRYDQALELQTQALQQVYQGAWGWSNLEEALIFDGLGITYQALGQHQMALDYHQKALAIFQGTSRPEAIVALNHLGMAYQALGRYNRAIEVHQRAIAAFQDLDHRSGEATALLALGDVYQASGDHQQALSSYQQALSLQHQMGDRVGEQRTFANLGRLLAAQHQPELAIVFYKQAVNISESIRSDLQTLPQELQQSYTETIAEIYRTLADLLLQQNRVLEAQRVLDLLRVQELDDYLRDVRSTAQTETGIDLRNPEQEISNRVIAIGYELAQLRDIPPAQLSDAQLQRLSELDATQRQLTEDFQGFLNSPEIQALVAQLDASLQEQDILARADEFINLQNNLRDIDQNAVLIYPLILEDRLELVVVTPFSEPARYPVQVEAAELNAAIVEFRQALDDPTSDPQPIAQKLYEWLIAPMASDLEAIGAETLLYAPDGALRYVPLAALHDGDQWLTERYRINHITAASLQDFTLRPDPQPQILAAAFSEGSFEFQVGQRSFAFGGLPFAGVEVENLTAAFPGTTQLINDDFSRTRVEPIMDSHTIVHLATHAAFVPGSPADSFILFGNGDRLTLQEIRETWQGRFNWVDLIVLSACETGLGGDTLGNGEEILGFGYLMQEAGAEAAIASLWQVNDGGTQVLMNRFYSMLQQGHSKVEALQQAQTALIEGDLSASELERAGVTIVSDRRSTSTGSNLSHPYYWAPFILIGNGL